MMFILSSLRARGMKLLLRRSVIAISLRWGENEAQSLCFVPGVFQRASASLVVEVLDY